MTNALNLLIRVVRRRVNAGEALDEVLKDYPKLTEEEMAAVKNAVGVQA